MSRLAVELAGIRLQNPVLAASGTFGYGREYAGLVPPARLGAVITKGTSLEPWPGNPPPRTVETAAGMLNSIGLENPGLNHLVEEDLPWLAGQGATVIVNVVGRTIEEYVAVAEVLDRHRGVSGLELNISCPNVDKGGLAFGAAPETAYALVRAVRKRTRLPLLVKLSPNVTDLVRIAQRVREAGADGLSAVNTLVGMAIDLERRRPVLGNVTGGLSGPAIKPVALAAVWRLYQVGLPILGLGGIATWSDAAEFLLAGATAIAVGTATFARPRAMLEIVEGLEGYLACQGIANVSELVGRAHG
ncbi:MAG: dihydroorotate dehydrogenase [bacterium]|nr:dihydroorotate dehydrogenase [bacterium]